MSWSLYRKSSNPAFERREHFVNAGDQHRSQDMRWALGRHRLCTLGLCWEQAARRLRPKYALRCSGFSDLSRSRQRRCALCQRSDHTAQR